MCNAAEVFLEQLFPPVTTWWKLKSSATGGGGFQQCKVTLHLSYHKNVL
jgi:hypothetical protein